jgi:hypothetical protein
MALGYTWRAYLGGRGERGEGVEEMRCVCLQHTGWGTGECCYAQDRVDSRLDEGEGDVDELCGGWEVEVELWRAHDSPPAARSCLRTVIRRPLVKRHGPSTA